MIKTFRIFRYDPSAGQDPRFDSYEVPVEKGMTVLEALYEILENKDPTLAFRSSCREAVCGSCAMHINGEYRLACKTQVEQFKSRVVTIRPLAHMPIVKDLVVDMTPFFSNYALIRPYLMPGGTPPAKEHAQDEKQRRKIDTLVDCILCAACYGACPVAATHPGYLGPQALLAALRFVNDSRDSRGSERLALVANDQGVFRCHTIFNCQQVCPKRLDPTRAILVLRLKALFSRVRRFFA